MVGPGGRIGAMASPSSDLVPTPTSSAALRALTSFAQQATPVQSDIDRVMRALTEHDDWYVPAPLAQQFALPDPGRSVEFFTEAAASTVLTVFTDPESASLAARYPIGPYVGGVPGVALFDALVAPYTDFVVNPASPREHQWYISSGGFEIASAWAESVAVEQALGRMRSTDPPPVELLRTYPGFRLLFSRAEGALITIYLPQVPGPLALGFLANDRVQEFLTGLGPALGEEAQIVPLAGEDAFEMLRDEVVAGVVLNAGSPRQHLLFRMDILAVAGAKVRVVA